MSILVCRVKSPLSQVTEERVKDYLSCVQDELKEELRLVEMDELDKVPSGWSMWLPAEARASSLRNI